MDLAAAVVLGWLTLAVLACAGMSMLLTGARCGLAERAERTPARRGDAG